MHLLYCKNCGDVVTLKESSNSTCSCGEVGGIINNSDVNFFGDPFPLQIEDTSFEEAIYDHVCSGNQKKEIDLKVKMVPLSFSIYKRQ